MRMRSWVAMLAMGLSLGGTLPAHHSFTAEFDDKKPVKLVGKVTEMKWSNPHSWIYIDVETNGKTVNWALETGAANALTRRGWKRVTSPRVQSSRWMAGRRVMAHRLQTLEPSRSATAGSCLQDPQRKARPRNRGWGAGDLASGG